MQPQILADVLDKGSIGLAVEWKDPFETGFPPELDISKDTGEPWGVGPILFSIMAQNLDVEPQFVDIPWPDHAEALRSGQVDVILGTNTPQRAVEISFSDGRLMANRVVCLARKDTDFELSDVMDRTVDIACWRGSSVVDVAKANFPNASVGEHESPEDEVVEGRADLYVNDSITHRFLQLHPGLRILSDSVLSREYVHFGMRRRDHELRDWVNNWYRYHEAQGTIRKWCEDWWESFMAC